MTPASSVVVVSDAAAIPDVHCGVEPVVHHIAIESTRSVAEQINDGLTKAAELHADLLFCHPGCSLDKDDLQELRAALAHDDQAGFSYAMSVARDPPGADQGLLASADMRRRLLPRFEFVPWLPAGVAYIGYRVIERFRRLGLDSGHTQVALNDLAQRAGGLGLRIVLANHAQVQVDRARLDCADERPDAALADRFPHLPALLESHARSAPALARRAMQRVDAPDSVVIDCFGYPALLNGTTIYARDFLAGLNAFNARARRKITVLIDPAAQALMGLSGLSHLKFCTDPRHLEPHFTLIRIGQPFARAVLDRALTHAMHGVNVFFDTISQDVSSLHGERLEILWSDLSIAYRDLVFISEASRRAFIARYPMRDAKAHVVHPSLSLGDYGPVASGTGPRGDTDAPLLIVGNSFAHKDVDHTLAVLLDHDALVNRRLQVLTNSTPRPHPRMEVFASGQLDQDTVIRLYAGCRALVYPSYYEGFGLPLMEALHHGKPAIARDLPPFREIRDLLGPVGQNIHLFSDEKSLLRLMSDLPVWHDAPNASEPMNWTEVASRVMALADRGSATYSPQRHREALTLTQHVPWLDLNSMEGRAVAAEAHAQALQDIARQLEAQRDELMRGHEHLTMQRNQLALELHVATQQKHALELERTELLQSRSWRVTAPLRWLMGRLGRLGRLRRRSGRA